MQPAAESLAMLANTTLLLRLLLLLNEGTPRPSNLQAETKVDADDPVASILMMQHEISATCHISEAATVVATISEHETDPDALLNKTLAPQSSQDIWPEIKEDAWFLLK